MWGEGDIIMSNIELLEMLTNQARLFRADSDYFNRNRHMHAQLIGSPSQLQIDAVLAGFINYIGMSVGVDYGIYASDFEKKATSIPSSCHNADNLNPIPICR